MPKPIHLACAAALLFAPLTNFATTDEVALYTIDESGNEVPLTLPREEYSARLRSLVGEVGRETVAGLERHEGARPGWRLRTAVVGIGLNAGIGLGPIWQVSATPRFRVAFSRVSDLALP